MNNKIFVGGINWKTNEEGLEACFGEFGQVQSVRIIYDRDTGRSRGFGFIEFATEDEANNATEKCDGMDIEGRTVKVSIARERNDRSRNSQKSRDYDGGFGNERGNRY